MKNKSRWLALMLTGSMMISPLSYTRTYAAENEQQYETNLQESVEAEEPDQDKKQDESQTEDAGNVKEDKRNDDLTKENQKEESDKVDNSSDKSDNQNSIEAETKPNLENNSKNNSENNSEEKDTETTGKNPGTTVSDQVADEKADNKDTQIKDETGKSEPSTDSNDSTNTPEPELPPLQEAPSVTGESVKVVKEDAEEFKMFKVSESTVVEKDGELDITIKTNNTGFDALYLGSKDDLLKASVIEGTKDEKGAWTFYFNVPKEKAGQTIPVSLRRSKVLMDVHSKSGRNFNTGSGTNSNSDTGSGSESCTGSNSGQRNLQHGRNFQFFHVQSSGLYPDSKRRKNERHAYIKRNRLRLSVHGNKGRGCKRRSVILDSISGE